MRRSCLFLAALVAAAEAALGQQRAPNWRAYKSVDGMPEVACASVTIGPHGRVWTGHVNLKSISGLDGYTIQNIDAPDKALYRAYESPGGQLWTVCSAGLREYRDGAWNLYPIAEIAAELRADRPVSANPVPIYPVRLGRVIFLLPDRLAQFDVTDPGTPQISTLRAAEQTKLGKFTGMMPANEGGFWITGTRGLARVREPEQDRTVTADATWTEFFPPESPKIKNLQQPVEDPEGGVTMIAEAPEGGQKVAVRFDGQNWMMYRVGKENIRLAWRGPDKTMWVATANSLFRQEDGRKEMAANEEIPARRFYDVAIESKGAFWLATSDGLFRYAPEAWRTAPMIQNPEKSIRGITEDQEGRLWAVDEDSLNVLQTNRWTNYPIPEVMARDLLGGGQLYSLANGTLAFPAGNQLVQFDPRNETFRYVPQNPRTVIRPIGLLKDGTLCVQTSSLEPGYESRRLEVFNGVNFLPFPYAQPDAKMGNELVLFNSVEDNLWLCGNKAVSRYNEGKWQPFGSPESKAPEGISCITEINEDTVWCGARDKIWQCDGKSWQPVAAGFDRINALASGRDGSVWVASENGLFRFLRGVLVENGPQEGLPDGATRQIYEDRRGRIWAGTAHGLSLYHPEADPDPPETFVADLGPKNSLSEGFGVTVSFKGQDKWKYTPGDQLLYSYRLDEQEWSRFQPEKSATFPDLPAGKHYFQVRSMDRNWNVDPKPALLEFTVTIPWYKESRLLLIASAGLAVALFFAGLAFNRHLRLVRSHAEVEAKVALRTKQLEVANRELLHSQKMNALGTLAAGIAHDFNNILSIIKGSAQIIEDNLDKPEKIRTRTDRIRTVVEQGAGIVKAMLGFSRGSDQQFAMCDVNAVIGDTVKLLGDRFLREVQVQFHPTPSLPEVPASRDFIQQILLNLIFNAAEAMAEQRQVILSVKLSGQLPPGMVLAPAQTPKYVVISVKDFGCGIAPEILPRIFEPFFTTKSLSARRGTGLGLSMAYELAQQMEAGLAVESEVGKGSVFTLILPVRDLPVDNPGKKG